MLHKRGLFRHSNGENQGGLCLFQFNSRIELFMDNLTQPCSIFYFPPDLRSRVLSAGWRPRQALDILLAVWGIRRQYPVEMSATGNNIILPHINFNPCGRCKREATFTKQCQQITMRPKMESSSESTSF